MACYDYDLNDTLYLHTPKVKHTFTSSDAQVWYKMFLGNDKIEMLNEALQVCHRWSNYNANLSVDNPWNNT